MLGDNLIVVEVEVVVTDCVVKLLLEDEKLPVPPTSQVPFSN